MKRERISGPNLHRAAKVEASGIDKKNRTLTLSFSSETPYTRGGFWSEPWVEVLGHKADEVDMQRFDTGAAPVLYGHDSYTRENHIGVVKRAWIEDGRGMAEIQLSRRDDVEDLLRDIEDGIVSNVSVGYQINERTLVKQNSDGPDEYRVTRWTPMEISLVSIPADATVGVGRSADEPRTFVITPIEESNMSRENANNGATATDNADNQAAVLAARAEGARIERQRVSDINAAVRAAGLGEEFAARLIAEDTSIDAARAAVLDELSKRAKQTQVDNRITGGRDLTREAAIEGMEDVFAVRMDPKHKPGEHAMRYRSLSLIEIAKRALVQFGGHNANTIDGMDKREVAGLFLRSHSSSDFPLLLANSATKFLRAQYTENEPSYMRWASRGANFTDFKVRDVDQIANNPDFVLKAEGEEISYGTAGEGREQYRVFTYSRGLKFSREMLINDDLGAFARLMTGFGNSARRKENALVYAQVLSNPNMADGVALFSTTLHGANLAASGSAISVASLAAGRLVMRNQTGLQGELLNIAPAFLLCGPAKEQEAYQFTSSNYVPATPGTVNEFRAGGRTAVEPIIESIITGNQWYLAARGGAGADTVEYAYLDGGEGVYTETAYDFDTDAMKIKARIDFGTKVIDYRGLYKNPGA